MISADVDLVEALGSELQVFHFSIDAKRVLAEGPPTGAPTS